MRLSHKYYKPHFLMRSKDVSTLRIIDLWRFKSDKSNKFYIVEVEYFRSHFYGIKFYWKGVAESKDRYSLLTNDFEPRTIVMSCIAVLMQYYRKDENASFGFVGANDMIESVIEDSPNKRFRFYRRMMLTLFSNDKFQQMKDVKNSMYLLVNKRMLASEAVSIQQIEKEISNLYVGEYSFVLEP